MNKTENLVYMTVQTGHNFRVSVGEVCVCVCARAEYSLKLIKINVNSVPFDSPAIS